MTGRSNVAQRGIEMPSKLQATPCAKRTREGETRCGWCDECRRHARWFAKTHPIEERLRAALKHGPLDYHTLARKVFPIEDMPRAWNYRAEGGPPGCYMVLTAALGRYGCHESFQPRGPSMIYPPPPRPLTGDKDPIVG